MENEARNFQRYPWATGPHWIPVPKRIRVRFGNRYVADSQRVMLMPGLPAVYYFPEKHVCMDLLERSDHKSHSENLGEASYWHLRAGDKRVENAAWCYESPTEQAPENLSKYIAFDWKAMDMWLEEDEPVRVHPRDPYTRLDVINSSRHVKIVLEDQILADTTRPTLLFETGLPTRFYIPVTDVRMDLLEPSGKKTECPYKGTASYYSTVIGGKKIENIAWYYPFPQPEVIKIKDLVCFYTERMDELIVDGESLPKLGMPKP